MRDLRAGIAAGRFHVPNPRLALRASGGALIAVMHAVLLGELGKQADCEHAEGVLRSFGLDPAEAAEIARRPMPDAIDPEEARTMTDSPAGPHRIDVHAHYLAPPYKEALAETETWLIGGIPVPEWTPALALEFMNAHGIAVQMLSVSDPAVEFVEGKRAPALARACNDYVAGVVDDHPGASERSRSSRCATSSRRAQRQPGPWMTCASTAWVCSRATAAATRATRTSSRCFQT